MMPEDITCPKETRDLLSECCVGKKFNIYIIRNFYKLFSIINKKKKKKKKKKKV